MHDSEKRLDFLIRPVMGRADFSGQNMGRRKVTINYNDKGLFF